MCPSPSLGVELGFRAPSPRAASGRELVWPMVLVFRCDGQGTLSHTRSAHSVGRQPAKAVCTVPWTVSSCEAAPGIAAWSLFCGETANCRGVVLLGSWGHRATCTPWLRLLGIVPPSSSGRKPITAHDFGCRREAECARTGWSRT
jgi:hypothetical protein